MSDKVKTILMGLAVIVFVLVVGFLLFGGNSGKQMVKNLKTNYGGGLDRNVVVTNAITGEEIWSYSGKCYIDGKSKAGDVIIIYYEGDIAKKADFIGDMINISVIEK